jgi:hypothetical protein
MNNLFTPEAWLELNSLKSEDFPELIPEQTPLTVRDLEMAKGCYDMRLPLADPCRLCGGFNLRVGDWVCWGACSNCANPEDY